MSVLGHGIVMAAGRGGRMRPLTDSVPKALVPCGRHTLLQEQMSRVGSWVDNLHVTVGYMAEQVSVVARSSAAFSIVDIGTENNAWWIGRCEVGQLDEPVLVATCDNLMDIDVVGLLEDYRLVGEPPCMVVPTEPLPDTSGDYIFHRDRIVTDLSRDRVAKRFCSGLQILNPHAVSLLCPYGSSFNEVWAALMEREALMVSSIEPEHWFAVDTVEHLAALDGWLSEGSKANSRMP